MKTAELRDLDMEALGRELAEAKSELFNLRFQLATNQLDNTARLRHVRRQIARIATVLRDHEIAEWHATKAPEESRKARTGTGS
ncbi:MAG: 50S ribosomal protein L29 [Actinomycetota bacterium]